MLQEREHWLRLPQPEPLPHDDEGPNTVASSRSVSTSLSAVETQKLLQNVPSAYRTQINDALLAALALTLREWTASQSIHVDLEGHGREDLFDEVDLSRTVGWFTTIFPVLLELGDTDTTGSILTAVKERLRAVPGRGIGYGVLRYLTVDDEQRGALARRAPEISFNYLGQFGRSGSGSSRFRVLRDSLGHEVAREGTRSHVLAINSVVQDDQLHTSWTYSANIHRRSTIEALADSYTEHLRGIIDHCCNTATTRSTPGDFPLANLDERGLERILESLRPDGG